MENCEVCIRRFMPRGGHVDYPCSDHPSECIKDRAENEFSDWDELGDASCIKDERDSDGRIDDWRWA